MYAQPFPYAETLTTVPFLIEPRYLEEVEEEYSQTCLYNAETIAYIIESDIVIHKFNQILEEKKWHSILKCIL